jgi:hypothetical protein
VKTLNDRVKEGQQLQQAINNLNKSYYRRQSRLKKRLEQMLEQEHTYFITFTIAPKNYGLKYNTYLRKIKEALITASDWILNSDYGDTNGRLHFHCVASFKAQLDYTILNNIYKYGAIDIMTIYNKNEKAIREYLNKTLNHALKQTVGKIYYSRQKKQMKGEL